MIGRPLSAKRFLQQQAQHMASREAKNSLPWDPSFVDLYT